MAKKIDAKREVLKRIHNEGLPIAFETAISICRDEKAAAPAKATAMTALFRAGGLFNDKSDVADDIEPYAMSAAQLDAAVRRAQSALKMSNEDGDDGDQDEDGDDGDQDEPKGDIFD